jgi:hypothetical protein
MLSPDGNPLSGCGELHGFSHDQSTAIGIARREATRVEHEGRKATICVEQKDGTFKMA